jgi:hypothetical protein
VPIDLPQIKSSMKYYLLAAIALVNYLPVKAQNITIPYDAQAATMDGVMANGEWTKASRIAIATSGNDSVSVYYKHDLSNMYFAFTGKLESANALFPEILFDPQLTRTHSWENGQWWFHVSATDCEHNGGYGVYNNCQGVQPDWIGVNNFTQGAPYTDTVEIGIPFSKIGFNPVTQNEMGIAFVVTNTATIFNLWPLVADRQMPKTWSTATVSKFPTAVNESANVRSYQLYPNPATNEVRIQNAEKADKLCIADMSGRIVLETVECNKAIFIGRLDPGIYMVTIYATSGEVYKHSLQKL